MNHSTSPVPELNYTIVQANLKDLDLLLEMRMVVLKEVFDLHDQGMLEKLREENKSYYLQSLKNGSHIACFVKNKETSELIGCGGICLYSEMPSPDNISGKCGYLMNIFTFPQYRKRGIGKNTVSWLITRALKEGTEKIYLEASEDGYLLYRSMGFEPMYGYLKLTEEES